MKAKDQFQGLEYNKAQFEKFSMYSYINQLNERIPVNLFQWFTKHLTIFLALLSSI